MKIIPAVDLMRGKVVRLFQGKLETAKTYDYLGEPVSIAKKWEDEGVDALHIIDLDAAFGMGNNMETIYKIINVVNIPVQVGGGIRDLKTAEAFLSGGAEYVILGTLAFSRPKTLEELKNKFGDRVIVALDHVKGIVMVKGWKIPTEFSVKEALEKFLQLQVSIFLLTSITMDGTLKGVDTDILSQACGYKNARIIAAGGVGSLKDISALRTIGVYGVIIGKALYEDAFTLKEALKVAREADN